MAQAATATRLALAAVMTAAISGCTRDTTPTQTLAVAGRANAFLSLAADGDHVAATWVASSDAGADVFAAVSDDGGRHFSSAVRVNDLAGDAGGNGEQPPRVVLRDRALTVVWVSKRDGVSGIRAARSDDGGRTFSPSRTISPDGVTGARGWESAAVGEDGLVHVAWLDGRNAAPMTPGAPHVHGAMRQDIVHAMWRADGGVVETPVAENVCFCCKTGVAVRGSDVFVVWRHLFAGGVRDIAIARSADGGRTFGAPQRVSADNWKIDACPDDGPSLAVEDGGAIRIAWPTLLQDERTPRMAIFEAISRDGGATFSPRSRVDASRTGASHPRLAVGAGAAHAIVWDETSPEGRQAMIRVGDGPAAVLPATGSASYPAVVPTRGGFLAGWTEQAAGGSVVRIARIGG